MIWDARQLRIAADAAGVALWSWDTRSDEIALDERAYELWDMTVGQATTFQQLASRVHPSDSHRVRAELQAAHAVPGRYEIVFRILRRDSVHWISARGHGRDGRAAEDVMFAIFMDITERKQAEEIRELFAGEMAHRVKNLFSIASALTAIAARSAVSTAEMAKDLMQRLSALGRAHDLILPDRAPETGVGAPLGELLAVLLEPYDERDLNRINVSVPSIQVGETSATTLALIIHELATNSVKYGALSTVLGSVQISSNINKGNIVLTWRERGGPLVAKPRQPIGFGSTLVARSVAGHFGGEAKYDWQEEGLLVTLTLRVSKLVT